MKFLYIFLSISILTQAHKVCVSGSCGKNEKTEEVSTCSIDDIGKKSCCHKNKLPQDTQDDNTHDGEEGCKCLCCLKVFLPSTTFQIEIVENQILPAKDQKIWQIDEYGFDYQNTFYHPPQDLS